MAAIYQSVNLLGDLLAQLPLSTNQEQWDTIEATAQSLANELRVRDVERQTTLGKTLLPQTLTSLLKGAGETTTVPADGKKLAVFEILRVGANLCMDHDQNREALLEAGFPQTVVSLLEGYADTAEPHITSPFLSSIQDLKIIRTSIGVLLNLSIGHAAIKNTLVSLDAAEIILKLSISIYPPGSWLNESYVSPNAESESPEAQQAAVAEIWNTRIGLSSWAWRVISELRDDDPKTTPQLFSPGVLPLFARVLRNFIPPFSTPPPLFSSPASQKPFIQADFETFEESCALLEALAMDDDEVRLSLAQSFGSPKKPDGTPCLLEMLNFIENGTLPTYYPSSSYDMAESEHSVKAKALGLCKGAIVKAVVEVAGEDKNMDVLWDAKGEDVGKPGGEFIDRTVQWIRTHKTLSETNRDDLIICSTLCLANLVRKDSHSVAIVHPPISLARDLADLLEPSTDFKVQHGVIGLLKHLAQSPTNRAFLGKARVLQKLAASQVWDDRADMIETLQVSAIGVAKHMCNGHVKNAFKLILPSASQSPETTAFKKILALTQRSDNVAIKSEGTRVLVNVIKSLWSSDASSHDEAWRERRKASMNIVATLSSAAALAQLIGRSRKYPLLINEGVVALSLLSTHTGGGVLVLDALLNPLPAEGHRAGTSNAPISAGGAIGTPGGADDSPVIGGPRRALDTLLHVLRGGTYSSSVPTTASAVPVEVRANVCGLLGHLGRKGVVSDDRARDVEVMKGSARDAIQRISAEGGEGPKSVGAAAKRALEAWEA